MSYSMPSWFPWATDASSPLPWPPWVTDNTRNTLSQPQHDSSHPPPPTYQPPSSSSTPQLPNPGFESRNRFHSTDHLRPQQHPSPSASLHAALREGTDFLSRPSNLPRLPPLSRFNSNASQQSSFGYIPNHFFYSPPQSPQEPDPLQHTNDPAPSSSTQSFFNPNSNTPFAGPSSTGPLNQLLTANHSSAQSDQINPAGPSQTGQPQPRQPTAQSSNQEEATHNMPPASASTSAAATSRKRSRPSYSEAPPSATKRRLNPAPIELDDSEDDEIEELGPDNDILAKEREALVNKQREESSKINRIGDLNCMICLEHFTNMTATHCGHIFCHECLTQALIASQRSSDHNYGTCPACRKPIKPKAKNQIVPLALMKGRKKK